MSGKCQSIQNFQVVNYNIYIVHATFMKVKYIGKTYAWRLDFFSAEWYEFYKVAGENASQMFIKLM